MHTGTLGTHVRAACSALRSQPLSSTRSPGFPRWWPPRRTPRSASSRCRPPRAYGGNAHAPSQSCDAAQCGCAGSPADGERVGSVLTAADGGEDVLEEELDRLRMSVALVVDGESFLLARRNERPPDGAASPP